MPRPDHVRLALPLEAADIARLQRQHWKTHPSLSPALAELDADESVELWHRSITAPPLAHHRVLVAVANEQVVGFAAVGPSDDPDHNERTGQLLEFVVSDVADADAHRARLLNAAVDTLRADGYEIAANWLLASDDSQRKLLEETGWLPDGAHLELGTEDGSQRVKLIRLHTQIQG